MNQLNHPDRLIAGATTVRCRNAEIDRVDVLGIPLACVDMAGMVAEISRFLATREPCDLGRYICFRDVHGAVLAQDDPNLMKAHHDAFMVVADGKPLAVLGRLRRGAIDQVRGIQSVPTLCAAGITKGWRHYFIGGGPGVADDLAAEMSVRYPGLIVAGTECPPFRQQSARETDAMVARINAARPDLVWVGLGSPKQDLWMSRVAPRLNGAVCLGVGAAFDIHTGRIAEAPVWIRNAGIEWAFRIAQEPSRLARRYLRAIPRFVALVALEFVGRKPTP